MSQGGEGPTTRRWILAGMAVAIPLAAVAVYFAFLAPPPPSEAPPGAAGAGAVAGLPPEHPPVGDASAPAQVGDRPHPQIGSTGRTVRVPDAVKGKWQGIRLKVETKGGGATAQTLVVNLGVESPVPGSKLRLRAEEFLPALQVKDNEITSASNEPSNPAALVTIWEDGKQIFHGWLFENFPDMQPFEHPSYRITLVEGIPKR